MEQLECDCVVVGAGPTGCIAALGLARSGQKVILLEGDPSQEKRLAGEWLHPAGVEVLERHGISRDYWGAAQELEGNGFVVTPADGREPVTLCYPGNRRGLVVEHTKLVQVLREECMKWSTIRYIPFARVTQVSRGEVIFQKKAQNEPVKVSCQRVIGADGKKSIVRRSLGAPSESRLISYIYGFLLEDVELPFEGFGHVIPAEPGVLIFYRIGPNRVRLLVDVPVSVQKESNSPGEILTSYRDVLPEPLRECYSRKLKEGSWNVRANLYRPRTFYGNKDISLLGDAVGFHHPLTAMGMTLGLEDAECLLRANSFRNFASERLSRTFVPELLVLPLYEAFAGNSEGSRCIREALFQMWHRSESERASTMDLLCGEETSMVRFSRSFVSGVHLALADSLRLPLHQERIVHTVTSLSRMAYLLTMQSSRRFIPMLESATHSRLGAQF